MENYGGTFNSVTGEPLQFGRIAVWHDVLECYPGGAMVLPSETLPVGTLIPAGTPVNVDVPGGVATLNGPSPMGMSKDDRYVGSDGCSLTVVTRGSVYAKRINATVTDSQKSKLEGQGIKFINA